jgi:excinuclease ABC subunit A
MGDVDELLNALQRLLDGGATVVVIEHNLHVIKQADWVIDLGPEGGEDGGEVVFQGTPEGLAAHGRGHTSRYLRDVLTRAEGATA